jgi:hypothetical protein
MGITTPAQTRVFRAKPSYLGASLWPASAGSDITLSCIMSLITVPIFKLVDTMPVGLDIAATSGFVNRDYVELINKKLAG